MQALKGMPGDFTLYRCTTPASHLLVGPAGVWLLMPYHQRGQVVYKKESLADEWRRILQSYMRIFGQEGLGRPDIEIDKETGALRKYFAKNMEQSEIPEIKSALVFTSDEVEIDFRRSIHTGLEGQAAQRFPTPEGKRKPIGQLQLTAVKAALPEE